MVILLSGLTLAFAVPFLIFAGHRFMQPHLEMDRLIASQTTPFVLIDDNLSESLDGRWADSALDHVRNQPDLSNRPLRFSAENLSPALLSELCSRGPVMLITRADMHRVGFILNVSEHSPKFDALVTAKPQAAGCIHRVAARLN